LLDLGDGDEVDEEEEDYIFEGGDEAIDPMEDFNYVGSRYHY
jgi:hypothetical protein